MKRILFGVGAALAMVAAALALLVRSTFPRTSGRASVSGISRAVRIETDGRGVPTVRAASIGDALFGLGYVHARDRLWQMEFQRRIGSGRLSEILGKSLVPTDRFLRTVGFRRAAEAALPALSEKTRRGLEAYVRGVNQFLAAGPHRPIEFRLLRVSPEPFEPVDCLLWSKMMAWDLAGNAANEIRRTRLIAAVGERKAAELLPPVPAEPTILEDADWTPPPGRKPAAPGALRPLPARVAAGLEREFDRVARLGLTGEEIGSNSWVVAGSRTKSRRPLLANDPHLGLRAPAVWYLARLKAPGFSAVGATLPGVPGVIIGHNARIAWGLTNLEPDVQDLYVETVDAKDPSRYLHQNTWKSFLRRTEVIRVRGARDVRIEVRSSVHGPIVTDVLPGAEKLGRPVALRWTGLDPGDRTAEAFFGIDQAGNWAEFLDAVRRLRCPAQNFVYADVNGHIGYTASGDIPIRPRADGLLPVSGEGLDDWSGFISFELLPRVLDPPSGYVATANNRAVSEWYPFPISRDWPEPYRARRIRDEILSRGRLGPEDMRAIQLDRVSYQCLDLLPLLAETVPADASSRAALRLLRGWNCDFLPGSTQAAVYAAWYTQLSRMPEDELRGTPLGTLRSRFLVNALGTNSDWCDDVRTPRKETCADFLSSTLRDAARVLDRSLGPDPARWEWERLHRARFPHGVFDRVPLLRRFFSLEAGQGGDASTVNVGAYKLDGSFLMTDGASYRQVVDLSDLDRSLFVQTLGQSGNVFDGHYRDFLPLWREGVEFAIGNGPPGDVLELVPRQTPQALAELGPTPEDAGGSGAVSNPPLAAARRRQRLRQ